MPCICSFTTPAFDSRYCHKSQYNATDHEQVSTEQSRILTRNKGATPSRGWVAGRLWKPPPSPPPRPGWLAGWRAPGKQPKYVVHHCTASSHAWYGYGDGFARVGGSATFQEHPYLILQVALPSGPPIKTKNTKHRITASDICSTANVVVTDVNLRVHNCPQFEIYTIHIAIYTPRHPSKEHLRLQLLMPTLVGHGDATTMHRQLCWVIVHLDHQVRIPTRANNPKPHPDA